MKANGIDDPSFTSDIDYQEVLDQQEIGSEELDRFSRKECQKEVIIESLSFSISLSSLLEGHCDQRKERTVGHCHCGKRLGLDATDRCGGEHDAGWTRRQVCSLT